MNTPDPLVTELGKAKGRVERALIKVGEIQEAVQKYHLPQNYYGFIQFLKNQAAAIDNLLTGKPLGFELKELDYTAHAKEMVDNPHLQNLKHISTEALAINDADAQKDYHDERKNALHSINDKAWVADDAYKTIVAYLKSREGEQVVEVKGPKR